MGWYTEDYTDYFDYENVSPAFFSVKSGEASSAALTLEEHGIETRLGGPAGKQVVPVPEDEDNPNVGYIWYVLVANDDVDMAVSILATEDYISWDQ